MGFDYLLMLQEFREGAGSYLTPILTDATTWLVVGPILVAALCYWIFNKEFGILALFSIVSGLFLNNVLKLICCVYRPWILSDRIIPHEQAIASATGYSFPSCHSTLSASGFGAIAYYLRKRKLVVALCVLAALVCAFSRNFLGVHTLVDVVAGLLIGVLCVAVTVLVQKWVNGGKNRDIVAVAVGTVLCMVCLVLVLTKDYPRDFVAGVLLVDPEEMVNDGLMAIGAFQGLLVGWLVERRFVKFQANGFTWKRLWLSLLGIVAILVFALVTYAILGPLMGKLAIWLELALLVFFCTAVWPLVFRTR